jgi:hypothetical protein
MKPRLNLATSPLENHRRFLLGASLAGAIALTVMVMLGLSTYRGWRANREMRGESARLQSELNQFRAERRELAFPWTKVFMDLERQLPTGVRVMSIAPRMEAGRVEVKLSVGATSDENKLKLLSALQESPQFSRFKVISETRPTRDEEGDRVVVDLVIWYQSAEAPGQPAPGRPAGK